MELKTLKSDAKKTTKTASKTKTRKKEKKVTKRKTASKHIESNISVSNAASEATDTDNIMISKQSNSASGLRRAGALITDYFIITIFLAPILYLQLADSILMMNIANTIMYSALLSIVAIAYAFTFMTLYNKTFGMMLTRITIEQKDNNANSISLLKYSLLYAGFFALWIISLPNPALSLLVWAVIFAELISYSVLRGRTMFEYISGIRIIEERRA
ncbi:MAG: hypothetical protein ACMXYL_04500 [Candidatus Woesearchaeota archaeon]